MYCSKCGNSVLDGTIYCPKCGEKIVQVAEKKEEKKQSNTSKTVTKKSNKDQKKETKQKTSSPSKPSKKSANDNNEKKNNNEKKYSNVDKNVGKNNSTDKKISEESKAIKADTPPTEVEQVVPVIVDEQSLQTTDVKPKKIIKKDNKSLSPKQKKRIIIAIVVVVLLAIAGVVGYTLYNDYQSNNSPEGKYNKGIKIYNELVAYQETGDNNYFSVDDECITKLDEGKKLFEEAGTYKDAKLFYNCFKIAGNLFRTNAAWNSSTGQVYLKQTITDLVQCVDDGLIKSGTVFVPETEGEKLFMFLKAAAFAGIGVGANDSESLNYCVEYVRALEKANNGTYNFCGKSSSTYGGMALYLSLSSSS